MPRLYISDVIARPSAPQRVPSFPAAPAPTTSGLIAPRCLPSRALLCGVFALFPLITGPVTSAQPIAGKPPVVLASGDRFARFVAEAAQRFGIPATWIYVVMRVESFGDVRATSAKGAIGLMQIMPATWADLRVRYGLGADPYDPHDNILAGAAYLRELHDRYGAPGFLAAYNAGPTRYEEYLTTGRQLPAETRAYVAFVSPLLGAGTLEDTMPVTVVAGAWSESALFPVQSDNSAQPSQPSSNAPVGQPLPATATADWTQLSPRSNGLFVPMSQRRLQP